MEPISLAKFQFQERLFFGGEIYAWNSFSHNNFAKLESTLGIVVSCRVFAVSKLLNLVR